MYKKHLLFLCLMAASLLVSARGVYQTRDAFLDEVFAGNVPAPRIIWLTGDLKQKATEILQHKPDFLRTRYWIDNGKSVWILEEIGKVEPITVGIVIENRKIKLLRVLAFRESRGDEVRHDFFTRQFDNAGLQTDLQLDRKVDGISGATLSVRALKRLARLALYLDGQIKPDDAP